MTNRVLAFVLGAGVVVATLGWPASSDAQQTTDATTEQEDEPRTPIPPITDADRTAAFPDVTRHAPHGDAVHAFVLFDQVEWQAGEHIARMFRCATRSSCWCT